MNLPNKITITRICLIPLFLIFTIPFPQWIVAFSLLQPIHSQLININNFINSYGNYIGAIIFIIAASTDGIDGHIARKRNQVTKFGIFLDPIADKLMVASALIVLAQRNEIYAWAAIIIIAREFIITAFRLVANGEKIVISANKWGKLKTVLQIIAIAVTLLKDYPLRFVVDFPLHNYLVFIAVIVTIYSAYTYIHDNINVLKLSEM